MAFYKIRPKSGTAQQWKTANPVLGEREIGYEYPENGLGTGIVKMKMGDGSTAWNDLPYAQVVPMTKDDIVSVDSSANDKVPSAGYVKKKFDDVNAKVGAFTFWDDVISPEEGGKSLTMKKSMRRDHMYLIFFRRLYGSNNAFPPYAYLLFIRQNEWVKTVIGEESEVVSREINDGKLTVTFKDTQWTRMTVYEVM